jgi:hypothetical protein
MPPPQPHTSKRAICRHRPPPPCAFFPFRRLFALLRCCSCCCGFGGRACCAVLPRGPRWILLPDGPSCLRTFARVLLLVLPSRRHHCPNSPNTRIATCFLPPPQARRIMATPSSPPFLSASPPAFAAAAAAVPLLAAAFALACRARWCPSLFALASQMQIAAGVVFIEAAT